MKFHCFSRSWSSFDKHLPAFLNLKGHWFEFVSVTEKWSFLLHLTYEQNQICTLDTIQDFLCKFDIVWWWHVSVNKCSSSRWGQFLQSFCRSTSEYVISQVLLQKFCKNCPHPEKPFSNSKTISQIKFPYRIEKLVKSQQEWLGGKTLCKSLFAEGFSARWSYYYCYVRMLIVCTIVFTRF